MVFYVVKGGARNDKVVGFSVRLACAVQYETYSSWYLLGLHRRIFLIGRLEYIILVDETEKYIEPVVSEKNSALSKFTLSLYLRHFESIRSSINRFGKVCFREPKNRFIFAI